MASFYCARQVALASLLALVSRVFYLNRALTSVQIKLVCGYMASLVFENEAINGPINGQGTL